MAAPLNHGARGKDARKDFRNTFDDNCQDAEEKFSVFSSPSMENVAVCFRFVKLHEGNSGYRRSRDTV